MGRYKGTEGDLGSRIAPKSCHSPSSPGAEELQNALWKRNVEEVEFIRTFVVAEIGGMPITRLNQFVPS